MATVKISTTWEDAEGDQKTIPWYFDSGDLTTIALAQTAFTGYETLMHAISGNAIVAAEVCFGLNVAGTQNPTAAYNVHSGAYMSFTDSDDVGQGVYVPGVLDSKLVNRVLNAADSDVAALITAMTGGGALDPFSSRGSASLWAAYNIGRRVVRKVTR